MEKDYLLDELDGEEKIQKEPLELPEIEFDPIRKIADIFEKNYESMDSSNELGISNIQDSLLTSCVIENLDLNNIDDEINIKDPRDIEKLILADLSVEIIDTEDNNYSNEITSYITHPIRKLGLHVAGKIYNKIFDVLCEPTYINSIDLSELIPEKTPIQENQDDIEETIFNYFKGSSFEASIAASRMAEYLRGYEERLKTVEDIKELKLLYGVKFYHSLIKDQKLKDKVTEKINDPNNSIEDIFVYSILKLHQNFLSSMGE